MLDSVLKFKMANIGANIINIDSDFYRQEMERKHAK